MARNDTMPLHLKRLFTTLQVSTPIVARKTEPDTKTQQHQIRRKRRTTQICHGIQNIRKPAKEKRKESRINGKMVKKLIGRVARPNTEYGHNIVFVWRFSVFMIWICAKWKRAPLPIANAFYCHPSTDTYIAYCMFWWWLFFIVIFVDVVVVGVFRVHTQLECVVFCPGYMAI